MFYQATGAAYANRSHFGFLDEDALSLDGLDEGCGCVCERIGFESVWWRCSDAIGMLSGLAMRTSLSTWP